MNIVDQPHKSNIGERLHTFLQLDGKEKFETFYILSAYVKKSGVQRLQPFLEQFRSQGGKVKAVVGIDQKNTSFQGLELLIQLCDELHIYHSDSPMQTFHPKAYCFENEKKKAILIIGSSNLTSGGLYTNYELNSYYEYDLNDPTQQEDFREFKRVFDYYATPSQCSKILSPELFKRLREDGRYLCDENETKKLFSKSPGTSGPRERIFGVEKFTPPKINKSLQTKISTQTKAEELLQETGSVEIIPENPHVSIGKIAWEKELTNSDTLTVTNERTNPTGGLRLTKAGWKINNRLIDQTTYFRNILFGKFEWAVIRDSPKVELSKVLFNVTILEKNIGTHLLEIRHKPTGEANQGNYTTLISWGEIGEFIKIAPLAGKKLKLYYPQEGESEPFFIEII